MTGAKLRTALNSIFTASDEGAVVLFLFVQLICQVFRSQARSGSQDVEMSVDSSRPMKRGRDEDDAPATEGCSSSSGDLGHMSSMARDQPAVGM